MYSTKIIADSISPVGKRITTFELTYPRFVHSELMTHRLFSRNSASSRAIPVKKMLDQIRNDPALPQFWGKNQAGMQAAEELDGPELESVKRMWLRGRNVAVVVAEALMEFGLHKQIANRVTEPWMFITVLVTATELDNWFKLRDSEFAQPEIAWVAREMRRVQNESVPKQLLVGEWHLPLLDDEDMLDVERLCDQIGGPDVVETAKRVSAGRCARVSYLTHDGVRDLKQDIDLAEKLTKSGHWSPLEHQAQALENPEIRVGNFLGWKQYRAEADPDFVKLVCPCCDHRW